MTLLTAPDERDLQSGDEPATPMLRLRRSGESQERSLRLSAGKCTVGSSPQCKVCLPSPEVRPLQCLITLEANAATVTRWATGVQLNGRDFSKASLKSGDRLTVGGWELEFDRGGSANRCDSPAEGENEFPFEEASNEVAAATWEVDDCKEAPPAAGLLVPSKAESAPRAPQQTAIFADGINQASRKTNATSHAFEDSLVQHLWTANFQARRRAKALINGIRAARFHADAMAADLSAMETELDLARAAYDSHIVNDDRLQQELDEQRRQHEDRLAPLMAEISRLRAELEAAKADLAAQTAEYETLAAELAAAQEIPAGPAVDEAAVRRVAELEAAIIAQSRQLESTTLQLQAAQEERERLAQLYQAETERAAALQAALAEMQAAAEAAVAASPEIESAGTQQFEHAAGVWQDVQPVEVPTPVEPAASASWAPFEPVAESPLAEPLTPIDAAEPTTADAEEMAPEPASSPWALPTMAAAVDGLQPEVAAPRAVETGPSALLSAVANQPEAAPPPNSEGPAWAAPPSETPAAEFTSTSFIDKYRHLLDEDGAGSAPLPGQGGPVIDDEFLSPTKAQTCASPADESDEALEAYMASMMRRVKSSSSSFANDPPARTVQEPAAKVISRYLQTASEPAEAGPQPETNFLSDQPLSFEELKQATRKVPLASDLAALREIANSTARTAIATHSHRRSRESAITKIIVAITATVSAGYLMASAPALDTWQFWAGAATCAVGIIAAVQVLVLERRGRAKN